MHYGKVIEKLIERLIVSTILFLTLHNFLIVNNPSDAVEQNIHRNNDKTIDIKNYQLQVSKTKRMFDLAQNTILIDHSPISINGNADFSNHITPKFYLK